MRRLTALLLCLVASVCHGQITSNGTYPVVANGQTIGMFTVAVPQLPSTIFTQQVIVATNFFLPCTPAPFDLVGIGGTNQITLAWNNPNGLGTNIVLRSPGGVLAWLTNGQDMYVDAGLPNATTYQYALVGISADLMGSFSTLSNPVPVTGLQAPTGLTMTSPTSGVANITFQYSGAPALFALFVNQGQPGGLTGYNATTNSATSFSFIGVAAPHGTNNFYVDARNANWSTNVYSVTITGVVQ